ncbi:MAG: acyl transferase [Chitinophagales bacterium]|nr:acyl transferase [Chitinophagales bacterium]MDW8428272.1 acyl transferase [Chitinophagales bacterium]
MNLSHFKAKLFRFDQAGFTAAAISLFRYQYEHNVVYRRFVDLLPISPDAVRELSQIPFLPISAFKHEKVVTGRFHAERVFRSSGTTATGYSLHYVRSASWYRQVLLEGFRRAVGEVEGTAIYALIPDETERPDSSLTFMARQLIEQSAVAGSGFYLHRPGQLVSWLEHHESQGQPGLIFGISYALLDFAEQHGMALRHTRVMETGGMKGRRRELSRPELHERLRQAFQVQEVMSEYGMTELLSQAYSVSRGIFYAPPWMKVLIRDPDDPFRITTGLAEGALNIIDLANVDSCSFIATDDLGVLHADGGFEVLGRMEHAELRGCSLLVADL